VNTLNDIPRLYVPINETDVNDQLFTWIQSELFYCSSVLKKSKPNVACLNVVGWGSPNSILQGTHLRTAAIETFGALGISFIMLRMRST
jgi:hypothetical protein